MKPTKSFLIHTSIYLAPQLVVLISKTMAWGTGSSLIIISGVLFLAILIAITISEAKKKSISISYFYPLKVVGFSFLLFVFLTTGFALLFGGPTSLAGYLPNIIAEIILSLLGAVFPIIISVGIIFFKRRNKKSGGDDVLDSDLLFLIGYFLLDYI